MAALKLCIALSLALATGCASISDRPNAAALKELAPTGKLRVGIFVAPVVTPLFVTKDPSTGELRGVTVTLGTELARKLGVPHEFVAYSVAGEMEKGANSGAWDVSFMPVDLERQKLMDF